MSDNKGSGLKDVFVSHSSNDKETIVKPIVQSLQRQNITVWYDSFELLPGDSLVTKINEGLKKSKIVLFCISEDFLKGGWTEKELRGAVGLANSQRDDLELIPLMICDPGVAQRHYPIPFGDTVYINWDNNPDVVARKVQKSLSELENRGREYWVDRSIESYDSGDFDKSSIYAYRALQYDDADFPAYVYYIASLLKKGNEQDAYELINEVGLDWEFMEEREVSAEVLDYVQDHISKHVADDEIESSGFGKSVIQFLSTDKNSSNAWRYLKRLYERGNFRRYQDEMIGYIAYKGREKALEWLCHVATESLNTDVRSQVATVLFLLGSNQPEYRSKISEVAEYLVRDRHDEVRQVALIPCYFFSDRGSEIVLNVLQNDKTPMVRVVAFSLLSGSYNMDVDEDWETEEKFEDRPTDPLLTDSVIIDLLSDPSDIVFDAVTDALNDGVINPPDDFDISDIDRGPSDDTRESRVQLLANQGVKDNLEEIKHIALTDPSEIVRGEAATQLRESSVTLSDSFLRELWDHEDSSFVRSRLKKLLRDKGGDDICSILLDIYLRSQKTSGSHDSIVLKHLINKCDKYIVDEALEENFRYNSERSIIEHIWRIIELGLVDKASHLVRWSFENGQWLTASTLAAGKIDEFNCADIREYASHDNPKVVVNAARSLIHMSCNDVGISDLHNLFDLYWEKLVNREWRYVWASIFVADGLLEHSGPDASSDALFRIYNELNTDEDGSFPEREAWERLSILGHNVDHSVYSDADEKVPFLWPNRKRPFFGINKS